MLEELLSVPEDILCCRNDLLISHPLERGTPVYRLRGCLECVAQCPDGKVGIMRSDMRRCFVCKERVEVWPLLRGVLAWACIGLLTEYEMGW
jgi:hypothetical protein